MVVSLGEALERQRQAFIADGPPDVVVRRNRIDRLLALVLDNADDFAEAMAADFGTRPSAATLFTEILGMISVIDQWLRLLGASVLAAVPTWFIVKLFGMLGSRWLLNAAATIVGGVAFVGIFVLASKLFRIPEVTDAVAGLGRKLHVVR